MPNDSLPTAPSGELVSLRAAHRIDQANIAALNERISALSTECARMERDREELDAAWSRLYEAGDIQTSAESICIENNELRAEVSRLTSELDRVRGERDEARKVSMGLWGLTETQTEELERASRDRERMDWLEANPCPTRLGRNDKGDRLFAANGTTLILPPTATLRDAIDTALGVTPDATTRREG